MSTQRILVLLLTNSFPDRWKVAKVTPLHKGGARNDINNYRPISVLPVFSKIIEKHVASCLLNVLHDNNMLYDMTTTCYMSINQLSGQVTLQTFVRCYKSRTSSKKGCLYTVQALRLLPGFNRTCHRESNLLH